MTNIKNFFLWFLDNLPDFLMSEPICYFVGLIIGALVINLILTICGIKERRY